MMKVYMEPTYEGAFDITHKELRSGKCLHLIEREITEEEIIKKIDAFVESLHEPCVSMAEARRFRMGKTKQLAKAILSKLK